MVFTIADGPAKTAFTGTGQQVGNGAGETAESFLRQILNDNMPNTNVIRPDERQFVSAMPEAHRKGEKAYHVKAFRGSKEGMMKHTIWTTLSRGDYVKNGVPDRILMTDFLFFGIDRLSFPVVYGYFVCIQEAPSLLLV